MPRATSMPPELPGYDFISTLGSGGFSDVFLYQQRLPRRRVAVKVLLTEQLGPATRARFVDEANLMAQLSTHPYIVTIYHAGVAGDGRPYFVMEHCSGPSLAERYKRERFTVEDALRTGVRLAGAVATAHGAGILHRDIKPANVLTNDFGWPALTDFGISSSLEDDLPVQTQSGPFPVGAGGTGAAREGTGTSDGQSVGMSVPWSPAEMFEDDPKPDVRSDVFSLAATIHTLLAGQTPFEIRGRSNGTLDLIGRIERGAITPIGRDDVPRSLTAVLAKGMATSPGNRYATAVDFARALQRIELELGYAATGIEVPRLPQSGPDERATPTDENETRARSVTTIAAQPAAHRAQSPAPSGPAEADQTRVRGAVVIDPRGTAANPDSTADPAGPPPAEGTVLGGGGTETVLRPRRVAATPEPDAAPPPRPARRRALVLAISVAAGLVLVGAIVAAVSLNGSQSPDLAPTPRATSGGGGDANLVAGVPQPRLDGTATSVDGTVVTFTVSNTDPKKGDVFRWARADEPSQPKISATGDIAVDGVTPGSKVCLDLYLQRQDGKLSEANRVCNR
ncbi:serine/threonine protein kinase [Cryobacterium sp. MP_M5]|uniref:serine/threonine-protein kinase n=1 Tax=unclassified Cryobacterium TaxID=2649013 RepID=UPI0018CAE93A|nr:MULTISPECIES: serine/threonine-protein kinase [unclassified Cryobacterium]MBG6057762.1 serine/threonine protein kinase [Cryobacterium sp. MP_M3]MEC5175723.1 serine/threonine protein kinase [Cryobacterium sp. MP_M5]